MFWSPHQTWSREIILYFHMKMKKAHFIIKNRVSYIEFLSKIVFREKMGLRLFYFRVTICSWGHSYKIAVLRNNLIWVFLRSHQVKKWLTNCSYNHEKRNISKHNAAIKKRLNWYCTKYGSVIVLGHF